MSSRAFTGLVGQGLASVGAAVALAAMGGASLAQDAAKPAAAPPAAADASALDKGRQIFTDYGCSNCHSLGDAGATGHVGPSLDGNNNLSQELIVERVTNGAGQMPSFGSQLSKDEIASVAAYVMKVAGR